MKAHKTTMSLPILKSAVYAALMLIALSIASLQAATPTFHDLSDIKNQVKSYLSEQMQNVHRKYSIEVNDLDARLKLAYCTKPLDLSINSNRQSNALVSVAVNCKNETPWTIYVLGKITQFEHVVLSKRDITKGEMIASDDLYTKEIEISGRYQNYMTDIERAIGKLAKSKIRAGQMLTDRIITKPKYVKRGDLVKIIAGKQGLIIHTTGIAMNDGFKDDIIRVKNADSKRIFTGVVLEPGVISVPL